MNMMREYASVWEGEGEQAGAIEGGSRSSSSEDTAIWSPWFTETDDLRHTNYNLNNKMTMAMGMTMPKTKRFIYPPEEIKDNPSYEAYYIRGLEEKKKWIE